MNAERATYLDSSAIVKLVVAEEHFVALRAHLRRRRPLVSSALARTEVIRALAPLGARAQGRGGDVLRRIDLVRVSDRLLDQAAALRPEHLRSLDAIHLATAHHLGATLRQVVTYDHRMATAATLLGLPVATPT